MRARERKRGERLDRVERVEMFERENKREKVGVESVVECENGQIRDRMYVQKWKEQGSNLRW